MVVLSVEEVLIVDVDAAVVQKCVLFRGETTRR